MATKKKAVCTKASCDSPVELMVPCFKAIKLFNHTTCEFRFCSDKRAALNFLSLHPNWIQYEQTTCMVPIAYIY
jgi:hypothetical protein